MSNSPWGRQERLAQIVASKWLHLTQGGSHCPEMSGRLAGAFETAGLPWRIMGLCNRIGAENPMDFHYAVLSEGLVYDLTYRQFVADASVPYVREARSYFSEWRDVRILNPVGWMRKQMSKGAELLACNS